jgi:hypothetical protein
MLHSLTIDIMTLIVHELSGKADFVSFGVIIAALQSCPTGKISFGAHFRDLFHGKTAARARASTEIAN